MHTARTRRSLRRCFAHAARGLIALAVFVPIGATAGFVTFESGPVRPLTLSPQGERLYAVNTPDNRLEIYDVALDGLRHVASVPVGLEPVAVAVRPGKTREVWVVNHLSDSVSVIDAFANPPRVLRTIQVGDEPRDIVFAGNPERAFITTAHRGQNSPYVSATDPGELTTPGRGRADVWVFDAASQADAAVNAPLAVLTLFTDTPRALAVSPNRDRVYAAGFLTGNRTTALPEGAVCNGGQTAAPCNPGGALSAPGGLPAPNQNVDGTAQPEVGLIVRHNGSNWIDELGRIWNNQVKFSLPDRDVFVIDPNTTPPAVVSSVSDVGTVLYNMITHPVTGDLYVSNTEARNEVRFEGTRPSGSTVSSVIGRLHQSRISIVRGGQVLPRHLNKHINYAQVPADNAMRDASLALPLDMAIRGNTLYVAAFGSGKIGVFDLATLDNNTFVPNVANHITVTGGGPAGLAIHPVENRLYVLTRFDNGISVVDLNRRQESFHYKMHNPEPPAVVAGRPFLYDARVTSSNGEASCGTCHVFGDFDALAWDLGDPLGAVVSNPNPNSVVPASSNRFHPMKGPMTTQSLRGLAAHGPMHWRGDRTAAHSGGDPLDEHGAFKEFNAAFVGLLGRAAPLADAEMQAFADFALEIHYPPNPIRALDNSLTPMQQAGRDFFLTAPSTGILPCNTCHMLSPQNGLFGSSGLMSFEAETQDFKIPHLRNLYQKVGMFGLAPNDSIIPGSSQFMGEQIRGFGFLHDGSVDTLLRFHAAPVFNFPRGDAQRREVEQFMFAFDSNLAPAVGQQITRAQNTDSSVALRGELLLERARRGECDLIVKSNLNGERGWVWQPNGSFRSDRAAEPPLPDGLGQFVDQWPTISCVPLGSGVRAGIDRDEDGVLDGDDNCRTVVNPDRADRDANGVGDACEPPRLTGFWPATAAPGAKVWLFGEYFVPGVGRSKVAAAGIAAPLTQIVSPELLIFFVPNGFVAGSIAVTTDAGTGSTQPRTLNDPPPPGLRVDGLWPARARVGQMVWLFGAGFDPALGKTVVNVNGVRSFAVQVIDPTLLIFFVPSGATSGPATVTVNGVTATSPAPLVITP